MELELMQTGRMHWHNHYQFRRPYHHHYLRRHATLESSCSCPEVEEGIAVAAAISLVSVSCRRIAAATSICSITTDATLTAISTTITTAADDNDDCDNQG